jgi:hypothetical protein
MKAARYACSRALSVRHHRVRMTRAPLTRLIVALLLLPVVAFVSGCGASGGVASVAADDPGPEHVHALGVDPADGSLYVATHTGLYRMAPGSESAARVGDQRQDIMGFVVTAPGIFLGSGHPDLRDGLPPLLGLIESSDAGRSWQSVSLLGKADFHSLRARGSQVAVA